jgi:hypothetical protein
MVTDIGMERPGTSDAAAAARDSESESHSGPVGRLLTTVAITVVTTGTPVVLPSPRPWDFPPSIDGDISHADDPMELDDPE